MNSLCSFKPQYINKTIKCWFRPHIYKQKSYDIMQFTFIWAIFVTSVYYNTEIKHNLKPNLKPKLT